MNDGSTDESKELISEYEKQDSRIQSYHFPVRKGVGFARNYGIQKASGDYIYLLDSDDYLAAHTIKALYDHIGDSFMISGEVKTFKKKEDCITEADTALSKIEQRKIASHFNKLSSLNCLGETPVIFLNNLVK